MILFGNESSIRSDNTNGSHLRRATLFVAGRPRGLVSVEKRFVVRADEKLAAFLELERAIYELAVDAIS